MEKVIHFLRFICDCKSWLFRWKIRKIFFVFV